MGSDFDLVKGALKAVPRLAKAAGTEAGNNTLKKVLGALSQPLFDDRASKLKQQIHQESLDPFDETNSSEDKPPKKLPILEFLKENFALGDALSLAGLAMLSIQDKFNKGTQKLGFLQSTFKNIATALTFVGSPAAVFGRFSGAREEYAVGRENLGALYLEKAQKAGHNIFHKYSDKEINKLESLATRLQELLVYPDDYESDIKERHLRFTGKDSAGNEIGALFCGPPGTGKTIGVNYILGNVSKKIKDQGMEPVIAKLDLANYSSYLKDLERIKNDTNQAISALVGNEDVTGLSLDSDISLIILESLINRSIQIAQKVKTNNSQGGQKQTPIIVIDEFDKVTDMDSLKNVNPHRFKNLLLRLNQLLEGENILLTSNASKNELLDRVKSVFKENQNEYKHIIDAFESRLSNIHVNIGAPEEDTQAKIMAADLLHNYRENINWESFGIKGQTGIKELDKVILADAIHELITKPEQTGFTGRDISFALSSVKPKLVSLAERYRIAAKSPIPDEKWVTLSPEQRIKETAASITPDLLKDILKNKVQSMQSGVFDRNAAKAYSLIDGYLDQVKAHSKDSIGSKSNNVLDLLDKIYNKSKSELKDIYSSKQVINIDNENYLHKIIYERANIHSSNNDGNIKIQFMKYNPETKLGIEDSKKTTKAISLADFSKRFMPKIKSELESDSSKAIKSVLEDASKHLDDKSPLNKVVKFLRNSNTGKDLTSNVLSALLNK
ncbi:MAG: AAA family ATPase [Candidatus Caenarcaniphilales bacterium]|nr:AAA family ATPase [Candidatus Caenarcaniphilales bacterium]